MKTPFILAAWVIYGPLSAWGALPLTESTFTEIIQEANVVTATNQAGTPAKMSEIFKVPDLVRTGQASRVELTARDQTITRVGANTTFTFAPGGRDILLKKGSVLFHSPAGVGGGAIKYRGSSAAVLGTTEIAAVLPDGRLKVIDLEGKVEVTLRNGQSVRLKPGQMVIVSADGNAFSDVTNLNLGELASHLLLVMGFSNPLSSRSLIGAAIERQNQQIAAGDLAISMSWQEGAQGYDSSHSALNDSSYYSHQIAPEWNPLDFPGVGPVGPTPGGPGGLPLLPVIVPQIVNPPRLTEVNPPHHKPGKRPR